MLEVTFYRDEAGRLAGFFASGHADFAPYGEDVVCAGVSAILQAARAGLSEVGSAKLAVRQTRNALRLTWPEPDRNRESVAAIAQTAELAVEQIASQYPAHVRVKRASLEGSMGREDTERVTELADQRRVDDV